MSREAVNTNQDVFEFSIRRPSDYYVSDKRKGRIMSATKVWKDESRKERSRISDIAKELESAKMTIKRQDRMIE